MIRFEVTNGISEWSCRIGKKVYRFPAGEHEIADPAPKLREMISCAAAAGVGVVVHEGLDEQAVESDEVAWALAAEYEAAQVARHLELVAQAQAAEAESAKARADASAASRAGEGAKAAELHQAADELAVRARELRDEADGVKRHPLVEVGA
jgi:hypothetical protein